MFFFLISQMNDILNNVKNKANNMVDKIKLDKKLDSSEGNDLKPNGIGREYFEYLYIFL